LGSAAFSKAIQAHDLHTGMDVCVKIIKNNKDFFDQSLDEIKLLKYVNKHDPADKYHLLRLYDYFYYRVNMCFYLLLIPFDVIVPMKHRICHLSTSGLTYVISLILLKHFP
jgi:serine/threonine protein kinase